MSWKVIYIAAIFSLIVMVVAYLFIAPKESPYFTEEKTDKIAEFQDARISGRKEGKKVWELQVKDGWTSKNHEINYLYHVTNGSVLSNGKKVISQLEAPRAKVFRRTEMVEAFGFPTDEEKGKSQLRAYINLGRIAHPDKPSDWTRMRADYLKYLPQHEVSELRGNVELHEKTSSIFAQRININHKEKLADIREDIRLKREDGILTANQVYYYSELEKIHADGNVDMKITQGIRTRLKTAHTIFYTDIDKDMQLFGGLEAVQGKKFAVADTGVYSRANNNLLMRGNVHAIFEKARVILKKDSADKLRDPDVKDILKEKTVLTAKELAFSTRSGDARAVGDVVVTQKGREAKARYADYDDNKEILTLTGDVAMKKEGAAPAGGQEWVKAKKIVVSIKDETFEAIGSVEAQFKL